MNEKYVVVTRVAPVRERGRVIRHAYGPYDESRATSVARELKQNAIREGYSNRSEVSVCRMLP